MSPSSVTLYGREDLLGNLFTVHSNTIKAPWDCSCTYDRIIELETKKMNISWEIMQHFSTPKIGY